jgi:hypothetical protein
MAQIKIEMDRGMGWEIRQEGAVDVTADALADMLPAYAIQYPHRAFIDGVLIAEAQRPFGRRGKAVLVRHD